MLVGFRVKVYCRVYCGLGFGALQQPPDQDGFRVWGRGQTGLEAVEARRLGVWILASAQLGGQDSRW